MELRPILAALVALGAHGPAHGQGEPPDFAADTLTGDWGGARSAWHRRGLSTEFVWKFDALRNVRGGVRTGGAMMGNLDAKFGADLDALLGWSGGFAFLHVLNHQGGRFNAEHVGSLLGVSNIEVAARATRLFHVWVQQTAFQERLSALVGLYPIDSEFQVLDSAGVFIQPPYGPTADIALTRGPSIFNASALGLRVKLQTRDRTLYGQAAVLDGIPGAPGNPRGTHIRFDKNDGIMTIAEFGYKPYERGHVFEPVRPEDVPQTPQLREHERIEGVSKYAAGLWRYSVRVDDLVDVDGDGNPLRRKSRGWYVLGEQTVLREAADPRQGLSLFCRYSATDGDSTPIRYAANLGFSYRGAIPGRDADVLAVGYTRAGLGHKFRQAFAAGGGLPAQREDALEVTYRISLNAWSAVQPMVQRYRHPGGDAAVPSATVIGARIELLL